MIRFCFTLLIFSMPAIKAAENIDNACDSALGLEDGRIEDRQLSASSYYSRMYIFSGSVYLDTLARFGRLKNKYAWCGRDSAPYFQIDFGEMVNVTGLATQGFRVNWNNNYVKTYTLKYSVNGSAWNDYSSPNRRWTGNKDGNTVKKNTLKPFLTRYLRIYPLTYSSRRCLRVEVYGCRLSEKATTQSPTEVIAPTNLVSSVAKVVATPTVSMSKTIVTTTTLSTSAELVAKATSVTTAISSSITATLNPDSQVCNNALGLEDGRFKDSQLSASSYVPYLYVSGKGSFNAEAKYGRLRNKFAWCANGRGSQYFQVDFGGIVTVTGLATQGLENFMNDYYVKIYTLKFSFDGSVWSGYSSHPNKQWIGNYDGNTIQKNSFKKSVQTRYLRIYPQDYSVRSCLRVEVYGCRVSENATTQSPAEVIAPTTLVSSVAKVVATPAVSMSKTMVTTTALPTSAELVAEATTVTTAISSSITATVNPDSQDTKNVVSSHTLLPIVSTMPIEKSDTKTKAFPPSEIIKVTPSLSSTQNVPTPTKENKAVATSASEANVMLLLGICVGCGMLVVVIVLVFMLLRNKVVRGTEMRHRSLELQSSLDGKEVTERFIKQERV